MTAQGWSARSTKLIQASGTHASTALPSSDDSTPHKLEIHNSGDVPIAYKTGLSGVEAVFPDADGESVGLVNKGHTTVIWIPVTHTHISVITASESADVFVTSGNGD